MNLFFIFSSTEAAGRVVTGMAIMGWPVAGMMQCLRPHLPWEQLMLSLRPGSPLGDSEV